MLADAYVYSVTHLLLNVDVMSIYIHNFPFESCKPFSYIIMLTLMFDVLFTCGLV